MADPTEKRLLARINRDLKWRSQQFRLGRKTYDLVAMGELLANIRRRKGYRFKPALVQADPRDSDITDHGESSSSSEEEEEEEEEEKVGDKYLDKVSNDHDESSSEKEEEEEEEEEEYKVGDEYLDKMISDDGGIEDRFIASELQRLKSNAGY
jgi:hypothetical protein